MMGVGGFKIRMQALKGREVRRVQQDNEKKEEQNNAWVKIKRVANCTNLIGIALKKALRKGDDLDHLVERKQKNEEERVESMKLSVRCIALAEDEKIGLRIRIEAEKIKEAKDRNSIVDKRKDVQEKEKGKEKEIAPKAERIISWSQGKSSGNRRATLSKKGANKVREVTGLDEESLKELLVKQLGWDGTTLTKKNMTGCRIRKEIFKALRKRRTAATNTAKK